MKKTEKKLGNKGFSLVELIIVIAIMAVLIGILAPQYLKYVNKSKVSTDITNAQEIATALNVAISDESVTIGGITSGTAYAGGTAVTGVAGFTKLPVSKRNSAYKWTVTWDATNGVTAITLGTDAAPKQIYPDAADYHTENDN